MCARVIKACLQLISRRRKRRFGVATTRSHARRALQFKDLRMEENLGRNGGSQDCFAGSAYG